MELDLATCIFAQKTILSKRTLWAIHLRADSSPQGGRDFFLSEYDYVQIRGELSHKHVRWLFGQGQLSIKSRILPASILGQRASSTVHKAHQLLNALSAESESLQFSIGRTFSLLTDFGAEGGLYNMPRSSLAVVEAASVPSQPSHPAVQDLEGNSDDSIPLDSSFHRLFCKAIPVADCDHSIHHVTRPVWLVCSTVGSRLYSL